MGGLPQRVWVTGASGFLGGVVSRQLVDWGVEASPVVRSPVDRAGAEVQWDLRDPYDRGRTGGRPPDAIFHLAAEIPISFDGAGAERVAETNRLIDRNVLEAGTDMGTHVIFASSCSIYGSSPLEPLAESAVPVPRGPYASGKLLTEHEGIALDRSGRLRFTALRISAPYGPGQVTSTVLPRFVQLAVDGRDLTYHGGGTREQDFIHERDVAHAFIRSLATGAPGVFNVAAGTPVTMKELAERVVAAVPGTASRIVASGDPDPQEGSRARYSIERAAQELDWRPEVGLGDGLVECVVRSRGTR